MTNVSAFFSEFLTSAVLMMSILAFTDPHNMAAPPGLLPLALFIVILGIGVSLGMQTGTYSFCKPWQPLY
jgi:aquaglyceroporin related protein